MLNFPPSSELEITDLNDCLNKILAANTLEQAGETDKAIALYQEVLENDPEGSYGAIAQKALEALEVTQFVQKSIYEEAPPTKAEILPKTPKNLSLLQRFYNLPIQTKQFTVLLTSVAVSVFGLVGIGTLLIIAGGRAQLLNQAKSELKVAEINYNIKIDQMGFGFRGQADNTAIIQAAEQGKTNKSVKNILLNETWKRQIEFATLVDRNARIIDTANLKRPGQRFNPNGLVTKAMANSEQIKISEIISYNELAAESPRFAQLRSQEMGLDSTTKPNFLIRYTITPIQASNSSIVGALISGDIVKNPIVAKTVGAFESGYSGIYLRQSDGKFILASSQLQVENGQPQMNLGLANSQLLEQAITAKGDLVSGTAAIDGNTYTLAAKALLNSAGEPIGVLVRGTSRSALNGLIAQSLQVQGLGLLVALGINAALALLLGQAIVKPLKRLTEVAGEFAAGKRQTRAEKFADDEIGELTTTFNDMADSIEVSEEQLAEQARSQEAEAQKQRQEKERLQQEVIKLLLEIEDAQHGNLTVRGQVTDGVVGSIADAFNATISRLRELVLQVQSVSNQVNELSLAGEFSVEELSQAAVNQASEIAQAFQSVAQINTSIQNVANSATEAAKIARQGLAEAQQGDTAVEQAVDSIEKIRATVAGTAKKVKQLAESSQEISQIVAIISGISEKTNLLAFNASVEAARAGEHGTGFRVVADEVRRLADRVTESTKDIQNLVDNIQQETTAVLQAMENSTAEVVTGTELVRQTQQILQNMAATNQHIDQYLQTISHSTNAQKEASQAVNEKIEGVAAIAENTATEAQDVVKSLQMLVEQAQSLQTSVSQFRLRA